MGAEIVERVAMLEISLDEKDLKRGLGQLLKNATDNRPMMRGIATELVALTDGRKANAQPMKAAKPCKKTAA